MILCVHIFLLMAYLDLKFKFCMFGIDNQRIKLYVLNFYYSGVLILKVMSSSEQSLESDGLEHRDISLGWGYNDAIEWS